MSVFTLVSEEEGPSDVTELQYRKHSLSEASKLSHMYFVGEKPQLSVASQAVYITCIGREMHSCLVISSDHP